MSLEPDPLTLVQFGNVTFVHVLRVNARETKREREREVAVRPQGLDEKSEPV